MPKTASVLVLEMRDRLGSTIAARIMFCALTIKQACAVGDTTCTVALAMYFGTQPLMHIFNAAEIAALIHTIILLSPQQTTELLEVYRKDTNVSPT